MNSNTKELKKGKIGDKIRKDIAFAILLPFLACIVAAYVFNKYANTNGFQWMHIVSTIILIIGLIIEIFTSNENYESSAKEKGLLSAVITSFSLGGILTMSVLGFGVLNHRSTLGLTLFIIGFVLYILASFIRLKAKRDLGRYFSHSLRITSDHELIQSGLYKFIRHPAYCGTSLVLVSVCLLCLNWLMLLILIPLFCLGALRINIEETMLRNQFGEEFVTYSKKTKRIIPFIY